MNAAAEQLGLFALIRRPSALVPLILSGVAMVIIAAHIARNGTAPQADEGAAAHLWQLLMVGQLPIVAFFAFKWLPDAPKPALIVLALQIAAIAAAAAPVLLLGW